MAYQKHLKGVARYGEDRGRYAYDREVRFEETRDAVNKQAGVDRCEAIEKWG